MSELAFNINGEAFEVPATATGWRVRRMKLKGAPEVVYARDGMPLVLPIDADVEDLKGEVDHAGRYRLDPVDDNLKAIEGVVPGYVYVNRDAPAVAAASAPTPTPAHDGVVIEAMRMNAELTRSIVDRFAQMMDSAATLLRAADGAGLPARIPSLQPAGEGDIEEDDEHPAPSVGFDLNSLVAQLMPLLVNSLMSGKLKVPGLGAVLDWRKATPEAQASVERTQPKTRPTPKPSPAPTPASERDSALPIDPTSMAHFIAVQAGLTPEEAAIAREVASQLSPAELRTWFDALSALSVDDAIAEIRTFTSAKAGGAS